MRKGWSRSEWYGIQLTNREIGLKVKWNKNDTEFKVEGSAERNALSTNSAVACQNFKKNVGLMLKKENEGDRKVCI